MDEFKSEQQANTNEKEIFFQLGISLGSLEKLVEHLLDNQILNRPQLFIEILSKLQKIESQMSISLLKGELMEEIQEYRLKVDKFLRVYKKIRSSLDNPIIANFLHELLNRTRFWIDLVGKLTKTN